MKKEGEQGRKVLNQYTRYLTVVLATFQAYGMAIGLEGQQGVVTDPGLFFRLTTVVTLVGGTMFLMWLGEQITSRGIGNGSSLIIFAGIVAAFPSAIVSTLGAGPAGRDFDRRDHRRDRHVLRRRRLHRVHGAGAAAPADHLSQASARQPGL